MKAYRKEKAAYEALGKARKDKEAHLKDGIITRYNMAITDDDFRAVPSLGETLYLHATHILSFMGYTEVKNRGIVDKEMLKVL